MNCVLLLDTQGDPLIPELFKKNATSSIQDVIRPLGNGHYECELSALGTTEIVALSASRARVFTCSSRMG